MKKLFMIFLVLSCVSIAGAASTRTWDAGGGADSNWTKAANWSSNIVPIAGDTAYIDGGSNPTVQINGTAESRAIQFGHSGTGTVTVNVNNGGTLNSVGGSGTRFIAVSNVAGTNATLNINTGGTVNTRLIGTGTLNVQGGTLNLTDYDSYGGSVQAEMRIGEKLTQGTGTVNVTDGGIFNSTMAGTITGVNRIAVGYKSDSSSKFNIDGGTLNMKDGDATYGQWLAVGYGSGAHNAELNLSSGLLDMTTTVTDGIGTLAVGYGSDSAGVFNITGGEAYVKGGKSLLSVGHGLNSSGTLNMSGGLLEVKTGDVLLTVGYGTNSTGTFNMSAGTLNVNSASAKIDVGYGADSTGIYNMSGGTANARYLYIGDLGNGTVNLTNGSIDVYTGIRIGNSSSTNRTGNGILNVDGGSLISTSGTAYLVVGYNQNSSVTTPDQMNVTAGEVSVRKFIIGQAGRGILTVSGGDALLNCTNFIVGGNANPDSPLYGEGTVVFQVGASGVSAIHASTGVSIDPGAESSVATLIVSLNAAPIFGNILLIDNQGESAVDGIFDSLNGGSAMEGALVTLSFGGTDYDYALTYQGIGGTDGLANDVMLIVPEPATLFILASGCVLLMRKRR